MWCSTWPTVKYASARTLNGLSLATPRRSQASSGRLRKKLTLLALAAAKSSISSDHARSSARAVAIATFWSKLGSGLEATREPEGARLEQTLGVAQVTHHIAQRPLVRGIAMQRLRVWN